MNENTLILFLDWKKNQKKVNKRTKIKTLLQHENKTKTKRHC